MLPKRILRSGAILISLVLCWDLQSPARDKEAEKKRKAVEQKLENFQNWCGGIFTGLPQVVYLPEPIGKDGLLTLPEVVASLPSMTEDAQKKVQELLLTFDDKRMVFHSHIEEGSDIISNIALQESALNLDKGVVALVSYPWLAEKFGTKSITLPRFMDDFVHETANQLVKALDVDQQNRLHGYRLTFEDSSYKSGILSLKTDPSTHPPSITVSPLFVRTVFVAATSEDHAPCSAYMKTVSRLYKSRERPVEDIEDVLNKFVQSFRNSIAFPIAHELAHIYLPPDKGVDEYQCDLAGIQNLQRAAMPVTLGAFEHILIRAIQVQREDLWEIEPGVRSQAVVERFCRLKKQLNLDANSSGLCEEIGLSPAESTLDACWWNRHTVPPPPWSR